MKWLAIIVSVAVVAVVVAAFVTVGSPTHQRLLNFDQRKITDLMNIDSQIFYFAQIQKVLPQSLNELKSFTGNPIPTDPQSSASYEYKVDQGLTYELCAVFNLPSENNNTPPYYVPASYPAGKVPMPTNWDHGVGRTCFTRTIDPSLLTPVKS